MYVCIVYVRVFQKYYTHCYDALESAMPEIAKQVLKRVGLAGGENELVCVCVCAYLRLGIRASVYMFNRCVRCPLLFFAQAIRHRQDRGQMERRNLAFHWRSNIHHL